MLKNIAVGSFWIAMELGEAIFGKYGAYKTFLVVRKLLLNIFFYKIFIIPTTIFKKVAFLTRVLQPIL